MIKKLVVFAFSILFLNINLFAQVVPCQLANVDQDSIRLFPARTGYRIESIRTDEISDKRAMGEEGLYKELEKRLGDKWDPIWETKNIPYVFYEILVGQDRIGWIFGANQGWSDNDNAQLMLAIDLDERIQEFYYQKLPSKENDKLQTKEFYSQFTGLTLEHFYIHEYLKKNKIYDTDILPIDMINKIQDPSLDEHEGFQKTLLGIKKVLIYIDDFKFENKFSKEETFDKLKYLINNKNKILLSNQNIDEIIKKNFPKSSKYIFDLVSLKNIDSIISERLGEQPEKTSKSLDSLYPVYVIYRDDTYQTPFTRGIIDGVILPINLTTSSGDFSMIISIGAQGKQKGKIISLKINKIDFWQFNEISLVNFYAKEVLEKNKKNNEKIDKINPIKNIAIDGKDITFETKKAVKKILVMVDEVYLRNFFKKHVITKNIEEYLKKKNR